MYLLCLYSSMATDYRRQTTGDRLQATDYRRQTTGDRHQKCGVWQIAFQLFSCDFCLLS